MLSSFFYLYLRNEIEDMSRYFNFFVVLWKVVPAELVLEVFYKKFQEMVGQTAISLLRRINIKIIFRFWMKIWKAQNKELLNVIKYCMQHEENSIFSILLRPDKIIAPWIRKIDSWCLKIPFLNFWYDHFSQRYGPSKNLKFMGFLSCSFHFCEECISNYFVKSHFFS